jgi:5-methylcytosine-specific restriction endonuclease McrA
MARKSKVTLEELVRKAQKYNIDITGLNKGEIHNAIQDYRMAHDPKFKAFVESKISNHYGRQIQRLSESQNHRCCYCGQHTFIGSKTPKGFSKWQLATVEHVVPRSLGGSNSWENLVMACSECNNLRGNLPDAMAFYRSLHNVRSWNTAEAEAAKMIEAQMKRDQQAADEKVAKGELAAVLRLCLIYRFAPEQMAEIETEVFSKLKDGDPQRGKEAKAARVGWFKMRYNVLRRIHLGQAQTA